MPHLQNRTIEPAEVLDVNLTDGNPQNLYSALVKPIYTRKGPNKATAFTARPLDSNIKRIPLIGEVVLLIRGPTSYSEANVESFEYYYTFSVNIQNSIHHNAFPELSTVEADDAGSDYKESSAGNPNVVKNSEAKLGESFEEKSNIKPLQPFEGDLLIEGRWGQSIRFGSTVDVGLDSYSKDPFWKPGDGENGNPIIIIRNGQNPNVSSGVNNFVIEDINTDLSSIYLADKQQVQLEIASSTLSAIKNQKINQFSETNFSGNQIIVNSDRLIFNSKKDEIIFFSAGGFGISSVKSIAFDTDASFEINSPKIFLGLKAKEPLLLGDKSKDWLSDFVDVVEAIVKEITKITTPTSVGPSPPTNIPAFIKIMSKDISSLKGKIDTIKSKQNFTL